MQAAVAWASFFYRPLTSDIASHLIVLYPLTFIFSIIFLYYQLTKRIPSRLRPDQAPKTPLGIVQVDGFASSVNRHGVDLIFVHGLGSNPDTTWCAQRKTAKLTGREGVVANAQHDADKTTICWIRDFLPHDIPEASRQSTRVFFYNHDTYWQRDAVKTRLFSLGRDMLHKIRWQVRTTEEEQNRDLVFVAYSYGGLIVKQALVQAKNHVTYNEIHQHTKAILFLGTPHLGSSFTRLGSIFAKALQPLGSDQSLILELAYDSAPRRDLHQDFVGVSADDFRVVNFYEQRRTRFRFWIFSWNEFFVKEQSATYAGSRKVANVGFSVDHYGLNKFSWQSPEYKSILSELSGLMVPVRQSVYSVPLRTVSSFTSRNELSSSIGDSLRNMSGTDTGVPRILVLHGLGGIGKTQIALKYVEEHKDDFSPILWIDAESQDTIRASFERCAGDLDLSINRTAGQGLKLRESPAIQSVLKWFQQRIEPNTEWLVVINNADDTSEWNIEDIIPQGANGNVIITSQHPQPPKLLKRHCARIQVEEMNQTEASNLLLQECEGDLESLPSDVQTAVHDILSYLDGFALAIDLARAYLVLQPDYMVALKQYSLDLARHEQELFSHEPFCKVSPYKKTVWTVWDTTLAAIDKRYPELNASLLLTFLAWLDRGNVQDELFRCASVGFLALPKPLANKYENLPEWFTKWITVDAQKWDSFHYRKSIDPLIRYGLLQPVEGDWPGVTMHGLVHWRAKKEHLDQPLADCLSAFITAVAYHINQEKRRPHFRRYVVPHITTVCHNMLDKQAHDVDLDEHIVYSWNILGKVLYEEGQWTEAEKLAVQVMEARKQSLGTEHPDTLMSMHNMAKTYHNQGRWSKAEKLESQVVETRKHVLGIEHPGTLNSMITLALIYRDQGRYSDAEELQMKILEMRKRILGPEHPDTLNSMNHLVSIYQYQGRYSDAEELQMKVLEIRKRILGPEHPDTLNSMNYLVSIYQHQERYSDAEELQMKVLEMRKRILGSEHSDTLNSMNHLVSIYQNQRRYSDAEELQIKELETTERILGSEHHDTLISMDCLASIYSDQGRYSEAEEPKSQVMEIQKQVLGIEHPSTLISMNNLALIYQNQGRYSEGEELDKYGLQIRKQVLGIDHPDTLTSMNNLAITWRDQGRKQEALTLMRECVELRECKLGENHPHTIASREAVMVWEEEGRRETERRERRRRKRKEKKAREGKESKEKPKQKKIGQSLFPRIKRSCFARSKFWAKKSI